MNLEEYQDELKFNIKYAESEIVKWTATKEAYEYALEVSMKLKEEK